MGIFTPATSDLNVAMAAVAFVIVGFILAYVVLPFALYIAGRT